MDTLKEGEYRIPEDLRAIIINPTTIRVQKRKARSPILGEGEYRCKDCEHWVKGYALKHQWYTSHVCEMKPKRTEGLFYAQCDYGKPCENFKLREKMTEQVSYGARVYAGNGVLLGYKAEHSDEGRIFKDEDAFLNYPDKICYIPEVAFGDSWFMPAEVAKDEGETRKSIIEQVEKSFKKDFLLTKKQTDFLAEDIFYYAEWACICTYLTDFDLCDCIEGDEEGLYSDLQKEAVRHDMTPREWRERLNKK